MKHFSSFLLIFVSSFLLLNCCFQNKSNDQMPVQTNQEISNIQSKAKPQQKIKLLHDFFAYQAWGTRIEKPVFKKSEIIYFHTIANSLEKREDGQYEFAADLLVLDPQNKITLNNENIIKQTMNLENDELPIHFNVTLTPEHQTGTYTLKVTLRDLINSSSLEVLRTFEVIN